MTSHMDNYEAVASGPKRANPDGPVESFRQMTQMMMDLCEENVTIEKRLQRHELLKLVLLVRLDFPWLINNILIHPWTAKVTANFDRKSREENGPIEYSMSVNIDGLYMDRCQDIKMDADIKAWYNDENGSLDLRMNASFEKKCTEETRQRGKTNVEIEGKFMVEDRCLDCKLNLIGGHQYQWQCIHDQVRSTDWNIKTDFEGKFTDEDGPLDCKTKANIEGRYTEDGPQKCEVNAGIEGRYNAEDGSTNWKMNASIDENFKKVGLEEFGHDIVRGIKAAFEQLKAYKPE